MARQGPERSEPRSGILDRAAASATLPRVEDGRRHRADQTGRALSFRARRSPYNTPISNLSVAYRRFHAAAGFTPQRLALDIGAFVRAPTEGPHWPRAVNPMLASGPRTPVTLAGALRLSSDEGD